jgi:hypothetical protein
MCFKTGGTIPISDTVLFGLVPKEQPDTMIKVADGLIKIRNMWPDSQTDALTPTRDMYLSLSHSPNDMVKKHHCPREGEDRKNCRRVGSCCETE